jgi:hypothetical protein
MSDPVTQPQSTLRAVRKRQRWIAGMIVMLLLACAGNILVPLICIPKFELIYQDALPGRPVPELTQWIIALRIPLIILGAAWPIAGIFTFWRLKLTSVLWLYLPYLLSLGQILITLYALYEPMLSLIISGPVNVHP